MELVLNYHPCIVLSLECQVSVGEHSPGQWNALPARRDCFYCVLATSSACSREQGTAPVKRQKMAAGFGTKSCCQAPNQDLGPNARPTGDPACLRHASGTWGEAEWDEVQWAGRQKALRAGQTPPLWGCGQQSVLGRELICKTQALSGDHTMHECSHLQGVSWGLSTLVRLREKSYLLSCNLLQQSETN